MSTKPPGRKSIAERILERTEAAELELADEKKAKLYANRFSVRKKEGPKFSLYPLCVPTSELGKFGIGLQLFFNFLKVSGFTLFIMGLIALPALISNLQGDGLKVSDKPTAFDKTTLANQPRMILITPLNTSNLTSSQISLLKTENEANAKKYQEDSQYRMYQTTLPDLFYTLVFMIYIAYLKISTKNEAKEDIENNVKVIDYALRVDGIPRTVTDEDEVIGHFKQFGTVVEAKLARDFQGTLLDYTAEAKFTTKYNFEKRKCELKPDRPKKNLIKLEKKIKSIEEMAKKKSKKSVSLKHTEYPCLWGYVIFNSIPVRNEVLKKYENFYDKLCCMPCVDLKKRMPKNLQFKGIYPLKVAVPDAPSNINWENLDTTKTTRFFRKTVSAIIVIVCMFITFGIIMAANIYQTGGNDECVSMNLNYSLSEVKAKNDEKLNSCYCKSIDINSLSQDTELQNYCKSYLIGFVITTALSIASGLIIIIVNDLLKFILRILGRYERYETVTAETKSTVLKIFLALFCNTALVTLLLHGNIFGFIPAITISNPIPPLHDLQAGNVGAFAEDFDRKWYQEVGGKIIITWIANVVSPHVIHLILSPLIERCRKRKLKYAVIQNDMNLIYLGPQFNVTAKYAIALNTIFVTMFYCSGMPILLFLGSFSLFAQYWSYKYLLLRYNSKPPAYDHTLNMSVTRYLPLAAIFHLAIGIYAYGCDSIFPIKSSIITVDDSSFSGYLKINSEATVIYTRAFNVLYLFLFFLIIIIIYVLDLSLLRIFTNWFCKSRAHRKVTPVDNSKFKTYVEDLPRIAHVGLPSYDIRLNTKYTSIIEAMDTIFGATGGGIPVLHIKEGDTSSDEQMKLVPIN